MKTTKVKTERGVSYSKFQAFLRSWDASNRWGDNFPWVGMELCSDGWYRFALMRGSLQLASFVERLQTPKQCHQCFGIVASYWRQVSYDVVTSGGVV